MKLSLPESMGKSKHLGKTQEGKRYSNQRLTIFILASNKVKHIQHDFICRRNIYCLFCKWTPAPWSPFSLCRRDKAKKSIDIKHEKLHVNGHCGFCFRLFQIMVTFLRDHHQSKLNAVRAHFRGPRNFLGSWKKGKKHPCGDIVDMIAVLDCIITNYFCSTQ